MYLTEFVLLSQLEIHIFKRQMGLSYLQNITRILMRNPVKN